MRVFLTNPDRTFITPEGAIHRTHLAIPEEVVLDFEAPDDFADVTDELVKALMGIHNLGVTGAVSLEPEEDGPGIDISSPEQILREFATSDPIVEKDAGQMGMMHQCHYCHADDWTGPIVHEESCPWLRARIELGL